MLLTEKGMLELELKIQKLSDELNNVNGTFNRFGPNVYLESEQDGYVAEKIRLKQRIVLLQKSLNTLSLIAQKTIKRLNASLEK